ncbi:MAG: cytochrome b/b6 domain-containing protein [Thermoanaerobaculia bacterium]|nr:cytochrome b/b6 domain-containing protein [Thermoanaerobaculia bacterium]
MSFKLRVVVLSFLLLVVAGLAGAQMANDECLGCHSDPSASKDVNGKAVSVHVDPTKFGASIHGSMGCNDCHAGIKGYPHEPAPAKVDCSSCHPDAVAAFAKSRHAKAKNGRAATCVSCHSGNAHAILPSSDPKSSTSHANIPKTCASCHGQKFVMEGSGLSTQSMFSYQQSVHGRAVAAGNQKAAVCTDCHNAHEVLGANEQSSPIFRFNIPATCGKCHDGVSKTFMSSVHGQSVARGNSQAPVCTDCHGIHNIKPHIDPKSSVAAQNIARTTCGQCHGNVRLTSEFGLSSSRIQSYEDSYHGLAKRLGSDEAANCASCHGVHNILPQRDPKSMIHATNLAKTCGTCHPGAGAKFTAGRVHLEELPVTEDQEFGTMVMRWVSLIYIPLIIATLGGMALHNLIIWIAKARRARRNPTRTIVRMNRNQRIQHILLITSFLTLVITGFALAWPESWFALISGAEGVRRTLHRIAAVAMITLGLYHIAYMAGTREGRKGVKDFWFAFKDLRDVIGVMKYYLGFSKVHPKMGRFTYAEKAEYWALVWGTIVMGVTGLMLWFEVQVTTWLQLSRWWVDVALLVHFYEAILATLAIIIWHLYAVIFDPDVYPVSWTWFDGKMPEDQYRHEHELHFEELKRSEKEKND